MPEKRPPIVTVLGHVDHGKTTLLDAIRRSHIAEREAGGITQSIGATQVDTEGGRITFLDTPGHEAFSDMRERGVSLADIAILVVAADDGVMPQTKEALSYLKDSKIPFIVAFTKTDLPSANLEAAKGQLEQEEVYFEGRGGQTPFVEVSAPKNKGIDDLLEMVNLVAEVTEIKADKEGELKAQVIETNKDKRGVVVSAVVKNGTLSVGMEINCSGQKARVRGLFDEFNKPVKSASPGDPVAILGFSEIVPVGSIISTQENSTQSQAAQVDNEIPEVGEDELPVVIKVANAGSLSAVKSNLPKKVIVLREGVGDVTDSDVFFAKTSNAVIVVFEAKVSKSTRKLAENEGVEIEVFRVVYEIFEYLNKKIEEQTVGILGKADILATFPYNKQTVAGCKVTEGRIKKSDSVQVLRNDKLIGEAKITSLRREKNAIDEAKSGEECGVIISPPVDFTEGDVLVAVNKK